MRLKHILAAGLTALAVSLGGLAVAPVANASTDDCRTFWDVPSGHVFQSAICWAASNGITKGTGNGDTYSPDAPVTRGQMAAFLYRLAGSPRWSAPPVSPFRDVKTTDTFYSAITWLYDQKITVGVKVGARLYYQSDNVVTRGQMAAFLYRAAGSPAWGAPKTSPFPDVTKSSQFYHSITWIAAKSITYGAKVDGRTVYRPGSQVTRGQMAAFLFRLAATDLHCADYPAGVGCPGQVPPPKDVCPKGDNTGSPTDGKCEAPKPPPPPAPKTPKEIARAMLPEFGFDTDTQYNCLVNLWQRESGWRVNAGRINGPYGIPQANPGTKMASAGADWRTNPATQIRWGLGYIKGRYKTPCGAWSHFRSHNWY